MVDGDLQGHRRGRLGGCQAVARTSGSNYPEAAQQGLSYLDQGGREVCIVSITFAFYYCPQIFLAIIVLLDPSRHLRVHTQHIQSVHLVSHVLLSCLLSLFNHHLDTLPSHHPIPSHIVTNRPEHISHPILSHWRILDSWPSQLQGFLRSVSSTARSLMQLTRKSIELYRAGVTYPIHKIYPRHSLPGSPSWPSSPRSS